MRIKAMIFLFVCLCCPSLSWAQKCAAQLNNVAGDIIDSYTNWWDQGSNGFNWQTYINGIQFDEYGAERLGGGSCMNFCTPFRFTAKTDNVVIRTDVISGNAGGWKCTQVAYVVGHVEPRFDLVAVSQAAKDAATLWSAGLLSARVYTRVFTGIHTAGCIILIVPSCGWAMVGTAATRGLTIGKEWADAYSKDPFDENYLDPYDPPLYEASQLDLPECIRDGEWLGEFCAYNVEHARYIWSAWEGAYVSANRAASCASVGNDDCFRWQKERIKAFIQYAGLHTEYLAYGLAVMSDATGESDLRSAAEEVYWVAWDMQQCSNC